MKKHFILETEGSEKRKGTHLDLLWKHQKKVVYRIGILWDVISFIVVFSILISAIKNAGKYLQQEATLVLCNEAMSSKSQPWPQCSLS